jgi:hypothetical protein
MHVFPGKQAFFERHNSNQIDLISSSLNFGEPGSDPFKERTSIEITQCFLSAIFLEKIRR